MLSSWCSMISSGDHMLDYHDTLIHVEIDHDREDERGQKQGSKNYHPNRDTTGKLTLLVRGGGSFIDVQNTGKEHSKKMYDGQTNPIE